MTKVTITSAAMNKAVEMPSLAAAEMNAAIGKKTRRRPGKRERAAQAKGVVLTGAVAEPSPQEEISQAPAAVAQDPSAGQDDLEVHDPSWDSAQAALEAAKQNLKAARAAVAAAEMAVDQAAPIPEVLVIERQEDGHVSRSYLSAESIERDFGLPNQRTVKDLMVAALGPWLETWEAAKVRFKLEALEEAEEAAFDSWRAAYYAISDLTPPDLGAMAYKAAALILDDCFDAEYDGPTEAQIEALLLDNGGKYAVAKIYRDILNISEAPPTVGREAIRAAWDAARLKVLERSIDQAIADREFLDGRDHGLSDDEWTARDSIGEDAATEVSCMEGDSPDLQRLRIKALGWFYRYNADCDPTGFDLEERLAFRLFRSACKSSVAPAAELLAAE